MEGGVEWGEAIEGEVIRGVAAGEVARGEVIVAIVGEVALLVLAVRVVDKRTWSWVLAVSGSERLEAQRDGCCSRGQLTLSATVLDRERCLITRLFLSGVFVFPALEDPREGIPVSVMVLEQLEA